MFRHGVCLVYFAFDLLFTCGYFWVKLLVPLICAIVVLLCWVLILVWCFDCGTWLFAFRVFGVGYFVVLGFSFDL